MSSNTSRLSLPYPASTDAQSAFPAVSASQMAILDNAVTFTEGVLASIPAAGLAGRVYYATDVGLWFDDNGTSWTPRQVGYPARGYLGTGGTIAGPGWSKFLIDTVTFDPAGSFSAGAYVCPHAGYYSVSGQVAISTTVASSYVSAGILKNPTGTNPVSSSFLVSQGSDIFAASSGTSVYATVSDILQCSSGDKIVLGCFISPSVNETVTLASTVNYLAVQPICGVG